MQESNGVIVFASKNIIIAETVYDFFRSPTVIDADIIKIDERNPVFQFRYIDGIVLNHRDIINITSDSFW